MKNKLYKLSLFINKLGLINGLNIVFKMYLGKKGEEIKLKIAEIKNPIIIRAQTSDEYTFQQIFVEKQYSFKYTGQPATIIDAGANIGLAAIYFANRFPNSKIICLEPEQSNFELLKKNTCSYPQISIIRKGLWGSNTFLKVNDNGLDNWGFSVNECDRHEPGAIEALSVGSIMQEFTLEQLDLIKMDVEGSEKNIMENATDWLPSCKTLVIELHDRMAPGSSEIFFKTILKYAPFQIEIKGENLVCNFIQK